LLQTDADYFDVVIECSEGHAFVMSNPSPGFVVDFGRNITEKNPLKLFDIKGSNRVDIVYSQSLGLMYVLAAVTDKDSDGYVRLTVHQGVTEDLNGQANGFAEHEVYYAPVGSGQGASVISDIAGWGMLGGLALSFGATLISPTATLGIGAINFAGFVQTFYMSGNLPISNMPENYRAATHGTVASWVLLNPPVGPAAQESVMDVEQASARALLADLTVTFPYPPVNITSLQEDGSVNDTPGLGDDEVAEANLLPTRELIDENGEVANPFEDDEERTITNDDVGDPGDESTQRPEEVEPQKTEEDYNEGNEDEEVEPQKTEEDDNEANEDEEVRPQRPQEDDEEPNKDEEVQPQRPKVGDEEPNKDEEVQTQRPQEDDGEPNKDEEVRPQRPQEDSNEGIENEGVQPQRPQGDSNEDEGERPQEVDGGQPEVVDIQTPEEVVVQDPQEDSTPMVNDISNDGVDDDADDADDAEEEEDADDDADADDDDDDNNQFNVVEALIGGGSGDLSGEEEELYDDDNYVYTDPAWLTIVTNPEHPYWGSNYSPSKGEQQVDDALNEYEEDLLEIIKEDSAKIRPRKGMGPNKIGSRRRKLLLADPIASLGSSGFSYVIVSATSEDVSNNTLAEKPSDTVGASIMSRIRAIETSGNSGASMDAYRLDVLWNVLFWSSILILAIFAVHVSIIVLITKVFKHNTVPKMLHIPRLELLAFTMILPMIAAAGASALKADSAGAIIAGVFFGILLPFGYLFAASFFLIFAIIRPTISKRRAVYVVQHDGTFDAPSDSYSRDDNPVAESSSSSETGIETSILARQRRDGASSEESVPQHQGRFKVSKFLNTWLFSPVFGFYPLNLSHDEHDPTWLGRSKPDAPFVKRYGCFFEDTHGPQVCRVSSRYEAADHLNAETVGGGILVPVGAEGVMEILQAFGIIFAATKMVLFAVIINAPGGVNNIAQVVTLALVALFHIVYLRVCAPYRLAIELATEILAAICDMAVFICGIILVTVETWSPEARHDMGTAMLVLQAFGFLTFISVRVCLALRTTALTLGPMVKNWYRSKH
jgi:hypothetical protein